MNTGGMTERIFRFAHSLVGHMRGGGSVRSMSWARWSLPACPARARGRDGPRRHRSQSHEGKRLRGPVRRRRSAASATVGPVIPPSVPLVLFGSMTSTSPRRAVPRRRRAGLPDGICNDGRGRDRCAQRNYPTRAAGELPGGSVPGPCSHGAVGADHARDHHGRGFFGGFFTPTEAAVVACIYALILGMFVYRELKFLRPAGVAPRYRGARPRR